MFVDQLPDYIANQQPRRYIFLSNDGGYPWYELNQTGEKVYVQSPAIKGILQGIQHKKTSSEKYGDSEKIDFFFVTEEGGRFALRTGLGTWGCRCLLAIIVAMIDNKIPLDSELIIVPKCGESNVVFVDGWVGQLRLKTNASEVESDQCFLFAQNLSQKFPDTPFEYEKKEQSSDSTTAYSREEIDQAIQQSQSPNYATTATKGAQQCQEIDYDNLVAELKDLRQRAEWSQDQVRDYLQKTYNKTFHGLSDDEMLQFVEFMRQQATLADVPF